MGRSLGRDVYLYMSQTKVVATRDHLRLFEPKTNAAPLAASRRVGS